jgi:hypothetical protein
MCDCVLVCVRLLSFHAQYYSANIMVMHTERHAHT